MAFNADQRFKSHSSSEYQYISNNVSVTGSTSSRGSSSASKSSFSFRFRLRYLLTYLSVVLLLHNYTFLICDASLATLAPSTKPAHVVASGGHHKPTESPFIAAAEAAVAAAFGVLSGTSPHPTTTTKTTTTSSSSQSHSHIQKSNQPHHEPSTTTSKPVIIEISSSSTKEKVAPSPSSHPSTTSSPSSSSNNKLSEAQTSLIDDIVAELQDKQVQEIANELVKDGEKVDTIKLVSSTTSLVASTVKPASQKVATTVHSTSATTTTGKLKSEGELLFLSPLEIGKKVLQPVVLPDLKVVETTTKHPSLIHLNNAPLVSIEPQKQQQQQQHHIQIQQVAPALTPVNNPVSATPNVTPTVSISNNHNTTVVTQQSVPLAPIQHLPPANITVQTAAPIGVNQTSVNIVKPASVSLAPAELSKQAVNVSLTPPTNEAPLNGPNNVQVNVPISVPVSNYQQNATQITVSTPTTMATSQPANNTVQVSIGNPLPPPVPPTTIPSLVPAPIVQIETPPVAGNVTPIIVAPTIAQHDQPNLIKSAESISVIDHNQQTMTNTTVLTTIGSSVKVQTTIAPLLIINSNNNLTTQPPVANILIKPIEVPKVTPAPTVVSLGGVENTTVFINQSSVPSPSTGAPVVGLTIQPIATVAPIVSNMTSSPPPSVAPLAQLITGSTRNVTEANGAKILAPPAPALLLGSSPALAVVPGSSTNISVVQSPTLGNQTPTNITVTSPVTANTTSLAPTPLVVQQTTIVEPTTLKPHVNISLDLTAKNGTIPVISVSPLSNKKQLNQKTAVGKTNTSLEISGKSNVTVIEKVTVLTTTTLKPKKKAKSSLNSLDSKLKKLKSKFAAANIHDVIVIGDHEDGDDLLQDYDEHGDHHNDDHNAKADGHHEHHDKELKLDHDIVEVKEIVSLAPSKTTAKPSRVEVIQVSAKGDTKKIKTKKKEQIIVKEQTSEDKEEEGEIEDHEDHEHLLKGLSRGDVIHVDVGDLE